MCGRARAGRSPGWTSGRRRSERSSVTSRRGAPGTLSAILLASSGPAATGVTGGRDGTDVLLRMPSGDVRHYTTPARGRDGRSWTGRVRLGGGRTLQATGGDPRYAAGRRARRHAPRWAV